MRRPYLEQLPDWRLDQLAEEGNEAAFRVLERRQEREAANAGLYEMPASYHPEPE